MEEQKSLKKEDEAKLMSKKEFWIRLSIWLVFAIIAPVTFVAIRYGLFTPTHTEEADGYKLSGWGVITIMFVCVFLLYIIHMAKKGLPYGSMVSQCIDGYEALIPVLLLIFLLQSIKRNIDAFENVMVFFVITEAIAVPINPLRRWAWENNIETGSKFLIRTLRKALGKDTEDKK